MYRIVVCKSNAKENAQGSDIVEPIMWFDGLYSQNNIPFPILYSNQNLFNKKSKEVILQKKQRYIELNLSDIVRIECQNLGSTVFLKDKTFWTTSILFDEFEDKLQGMRFLKVHSCHLVNLLHIEKFVQCDAFITLSSSEAIPVDLSVSNILDDCLGQEGII